MRAEDVPAEIVEMALQATHEHDRKSWEDEPSTPIVWRDFWTNEEDRQILITAERQAIAAVWDVIFDLGRAHRSTEAETEAT